MNRFMEWIAGFSGWAALVALVACLLGAAELGFRLGRWALRAHSERSGAAQVGVVLGGLLGLLGLLLGFSFGIVEARYADRKALVLEEANAIGTCFLRAGLLPDERGREVRSLLRRYVELRSAPATAAALQRAIENSARIHTELWRAAELVGKEQPTSKLVGLFIESLNAVIDLHTSRVSISLHQRLPAAIFWVLLTVSLLSVFILGYASGLLRLREPVTMLALVVSIASVVAMIRELDTPGARMFRIDHWAIEDVRRTMAEH